jgi:hypothetical protein
MAKGQKEEAEVLKAKVAEDAENPCRIRRKRTCIGRKNQ